MSLSDKEIERKEAYRKTHPGVSYASMLVRKNVYLGRLEKAPCMICGATDWVHGHHDNYQRPLDVVWLCPTHHKERHKHLPSSIERNGDKAHRIMSGWRKEVAASEDGLLHGRAWTYRKYGCRCEPCTAARRRDRERSVRQ